jgi:hypothetical protein
MADRLDDAIAIVDRPPDQSIGVFTGRGLRRGGSLGHAFAAPRGRAQATSHRLPAKIHGNAAFENGSNITITDALGANVGKWC